MNSEGRRVAVVDDDAAVCESTRVLLEVHGFDVLTYRSGADFLSDAPDVACLIVDYQMPDLNGLEFVAELQKRGRNVPVIMITATTDPTVGRRADQLGVRQVLEKPLSIRVLLKALGMELQ